jgi:hypothetical protein
MMLDWSQYRQDLLKTIGDLGRLTPDTVRGYVDFKTQKRTPKMSGRCIGNRERQCGGLSRVAEVGARIVSELCHMTPETRDEHRDLRDTLMHTVVVRSP